MKIGHTKKQLTYRLGGNHQKGKNFFGNLWRRPVTGAALGQLVKKHKNANKTQGLKGKKKNQTLKRPGKEELKKIWGGG